MASSMSRAASLLRPIGPRRLHLNLPHRRNFQSRAFSWTRQFAGVNVGGERVVLRRFLAGGIAGLAAVATAAATAAAETDNKKRRPRILDADDRTDFFQPIASFYGWMYNKLYPPEHTMLLPPGLPDEFGGIRRTLVLNLEGTLVHTVFKNDKYATRVRPFVPTLLSDAQAMGYELVVFANEPSMKAELILPVVDPSGRILHRLFQESCSYIKGMYVKDLSRLNRDLKNVILVDYQPESWHLHPENAFVIKRFKGQKDAALVELGALLELIQMKDVEDVRPLLTRLNAGETLHEVFGKEEADGAWKRKTEALKKEIENTRDKNRGLVADSVQRYRMRVYEAETKRIKYLIEAGKLPPDTELPRKPSDDNAIED